MLKVNKKKICSNCNSTEIFIKVTFGVLCLTCYRSGIELSDPRPPKPVKIKLKKKCKTKKKKVFKNYIIKGKVIYKLYIKSKDWFKIRKKKLKEANYKCENNTCYSPFNLQVHHLTYDRLGKESMKDLKVLCGYCHMEAHDNLPFPKKFYEEVN